MLKKSYRQCKYNLFSYTKYVTAHRACIHSYVHRNQLRRTILLHFVTFAIVHKITNFCIQILNIGNNFNNLINANMIYY